MSLETLKQGVFGVIQAFSVDKATDSKRERVYTTIVRTAKVENRSWCFHSANRFFRIRE
jgi:hypothetical protein